MRWLAVVALAACSSATEYVPRPDGRARALWAGDRIVVDLGGPRATPACHSQVAYDTQSTRLYLTTGELEAPPVAVPNWHGSAIVGFWQPVYFGAPLVPPLPGLPPPLPRLSVPRVSLGGGGGGGDGKGIAMLAALALVVMPVIDIALAVAPAESPTVSRDAIDQVHAFNDLFRWPGSPCAP